MNKLAIQQLQEGYRREAFSVEEIIDQTLALAEEYADYNIWIHRLEKKEIMTYVQQLEKFSPKDKPLWGIPFAIKDNIDLANVPTTAACPEFSYIPEKSAQVVQQLIDAGAIPIGKTNMDQFATGLVGTRSPHGFRSSAGRLEQYHRLQSSVRQLFYGWSGAGLRILGLRLSFR